MLTGQIAFVDAEDESNFYLSIPQAGSAPITKIIGKKNVDKSGSLWEEKLKYRKIGDRE